ncbi:MAG: hypothetical protein U1E17_06580 [Geminicoccaceae bacterium]
MKPISGPLVDQLQHVDLLAVLARGLDDQLHRPAVGQAPHAIAAALEANSSSMRLARSGSCAMQRWPSSGR